MVKIVTFMLVFSSSQSVDSLHLVNSTTLLDLTDTFLRLQASLFLGLQMEAKSARIWRKTLGCMCMYTQPVSVR